MSVTSIKKFPFPIIESSFSYLFCFGGSNDDSEVYINRKGEVKEFKVFSTFLWEDADVVSERMFIRSRILRLAYQYLTDDYCVRKNFTKAQTASLEDQANINTIYKNFLLIADIETTSFQNSSDPVLIKLIKKINNAIFQAPDFCENSQG